MQDLVRLAQPIAREIVLETIDRLWSETPHDDVVAHVVRFLGRQDDDFLPDDDLGIDRGTLALRAACAIGIATGMLLPRALIADRAAGRALAGDMGARQPLRERPEAWTSIQARYER